MANYYLKHTGAELDAAVDAANAALPKTGGTMTGSLILHGNPSTSFEATPKKYVDDAIAEIELTPGKDGENGVTFTPSVSSEGDLAWSNDGGLENPPTVNIKGPKGDSPIKGVDYWTETDKQEIVDEVLGQSDDVSNAVKYVEQTLTEEQKAQARANIGTVSEDDCFIPLAYDTGAQICVNPGEGADLAAVSHIDSAADSVLLWRSGKNIASVNIERVEVNTDTYGSTSDGNWRIIDFGRDVTFSEITVTVFCENIDYEKSAARIFYFETDNGTATSIQPWYLKRTTDGDGMRDESVNNGAYAQTKTNFTFRKAHFVPGNFVHTTTGRYSVQLEIGSESTDFVPANGQGFVTSFGQTVYGGDFNWSTGKLTITHDANGELETPQTVQLDAQPITGLPGETRAFSTTGNTTVGGSVAPSPIVSALMGRVSTLESQVKSGEYIPAYWLEYLEERLPSIRAKTAEVGANGDSFLFFTDHHTRGNSNNTRHIIDYVRKHTPIDRAFHGGDAVSTVVGQTKDEALRWLWKYHDDYVSSRNVLSVLGNHEYGNYNTNGERLNNGECYAAMFKDVEKFADTRGTTYYYVDNASCKIRYIVLDNDYIRLSTTASESDWYINALSSMEEGWTAILLVHTYYDGEIGSTPPDRSLVITQIANDYNNRASGSSVVATWDFSNGKGKVACLLCGHVHYDYSEVSNGIRVIATTTDSMGGVTNETGRAAGNITEQAVDLFFINTESRTISTIRLGYGNDRSWTY